ncbi:hypothetical protein [Jiangella asiatica]|uniref:Terminase small subunit n=1 Tax=Jiangella asiatica TaxID=2530372 RepID=A0A4R5CTB5_9ACTN|nr:hypothetical protein [Jiangella asiatica]TDE02847.1 hypothetical protein E1269_21385 [Jiangella asiatica]
MRGGARNRSGPPADPNSGRSDRRGFSLTALPAEGYDGPVPEWPLMRRQVMRWEQDGKVRYQVLDPDATQEVADREAELWEWAWTTPQACAWSMPSESWRIHTIAMWVRTFVICESSAATAADKNSLHRFADQIGMTTAGLAEMGWKVAVDELAGKRNEAPEPEEDEDDPRNRMTVVTGGGA